ncbi:NAD(P)-dependent dehydrogenase, short-chain alcohol dehydrogenase family [Thermoactinomyces sp. DSM 45891]|uniref:SDR family NAD(P)-dependent oxidoreductase n=1 Tax=Thermoactinomyces sp. DSM 45891 TaxID=1761907 RepID=UPI00091E2C6C|nr:SDR family NAD(P)-dependent oxidoreductase [Thermoactinomyces sp. DSM 45891]SFX03766.1 NAD(P)-dependent dehydrogenase, short-chain alcohol dehydrogenase family [Thermoactinomyces sp. DSM 45891]
MKTSQRENIALITGANAGIGLELTRKLLSEGWQVVALNRSEFPEEDMEIQKATKNGSLRLYKTTDLTDYDSLRRTLEAIKGKEQRIDILFNNAGRTFHELSYTKQGRESHYELMTVVPYIILMELKELLQNGHLKTVINTSSAIIQFAKEFTIETLERPKTFRKLLGPYATSKLALSLWTEAIALQLAKEGIQIRSVDPGGNNTLRKGRKSGLPIWIEPFMKFFYAPPTHGANQLYEGAFGKHRDDTGVFLLKGRITGLKYSVQAKSVLERVHAIYVEDFLETKS